MKKNLTVVTLVTITLAFFSFSSLQNWISYTSKEGKYSILFPSDAKEQSQTIPSAVGDLTMYIATVEVEDENAANLLYMSTYSAYPPEKINSEGPRETVERFFKGAAEGAAKKINGTVRNITESNYKGFPGKKVLIDANLAGIELVVLQKIILVKNRFYLMQTFTRKEMETNADAKKFFDSFSLVE